MMTSNTAPHEQSSWLMNALGSMVSVLAPHIDALPAGKMLTISLTQIPEDEDAKQRWARSCDRCGVYVPPGGELFSAREHLLVSGRHVAVPYALCRTCATAEFPEQFEKTNHD